MASDVRILALNIMRGLLPYPDPVRRRRVRVAVRSLVRCEPWPDDAATTGSDVAQLALLRLLWLQRECRRAAQHHQSEAAVLLARSSVEACILGLYCLHTDNVVANLRTANIKATKNQLQYLVDDGALSQDVVDQSLPTLGSRTESPSILQMAQRVESALGDSGAVSLYRRFYVPTSTFFVHANAASLLRHVRPDDSLTSHPTLPWTRRSAVRIGDACVGILATAVADSLGTPSTAFSRYAKAHLARALTPLAVIAGRGLRRAVKLTDLPTLVTTIRALRRYASSQQAATDTPAAREARIREGLEQAFRAVATPDVPDEMRRSLREHVVAKVVTRIAARAEKPA